MHIHVRSLALSFASLEVFRGLDLSFPDSQVSVVLGPSGCGKTTLLNLISGVLSPNHGSIELEQGASEHKLPGNQADRIAYLFQEPRLLPWKTVRKNVEIVLARLYEPGERRRIAEKFLVSVGLNDFLDYYPAALSGGMRQRVAIARAFAFPAELMLLDEPFQALDLRLKLGLSTLFQRLWARERRTTVFVTHDIQEALLLGDMVYVLSERPAELVGRFSNPVAAEERSLSDSRLTELERRLYSLLAG